MELVILAVVVVAWMVLGTAHAADITELPNASERAALPEDGGERYNRLIHASSPYLLQHATNPVDWHEWGEAAFAKAVAEDKPIFLSVGYSTCHWCHVMARESFADEEVAELLNQHFVAIKLDREERPDIDHVYMTFVQATTGHGGWPMSVFLTPQRQPFYGGTYFPRPQFTALLEGIAKAWDERRDEIERSGERLTGELQRIAGGAGEVDGGMPGAAVVEGFVDTMAQQYDAEEGGFGPAPKFPRPVVFEALLPYAAEHADARGRQAGDMALATLRAMARGGMYDHLGGGFHRYSVDRFWHVPHFEKMLYDQGQLAAVYTAAWQSSGEQAFADVAEDICGYVLRDLRHPDGAFYSAEDADSAKPDHPAEHGEGAFYVWTAGELERLLGERFPVFASAYGVAVDGNIRPGSDPHGELTGTNQLYRAASGEAVAAEHGLTPQQVEASLRESRQRLLAARAHRPRPHLDDKILTAWNGLMISGLARTGAALERDDLVDAAVAAADFIRAELHDAEAGQLYRVWRDGRRGDTRAFADDYAFLIRGVLDCYRATLDRRHLHWARELQAEMDADFLDPDGGGWYGTRADEPDVLIRAKEDYDGAEPAATSVAATNCQRLAALLGDEALAGRASRALDGSRILERAPQAAPLLVRALQRELHGERSLVIVGEPDGEDTRALVRVLHRSYRPTTSLLLLDPAEGDDLVADRPWLAAMTARDGAATAYLCAGKVCQAPTTDPDVLADQLAGEEP